MADTMKVHTYEEHREEASRHRTKIAMAADNLIDSARVNANDTWVEQKRTDFHSDDWQDMYRASLRSLLSDERDHKVRAWFYRRGFYF